MGLPARALIVFAATCAAAGATATPQSAQDIQSTFETEARRQSAAFTAFSAQAGEHFFKSIHGNDWSCATCHTQDPRDAGRHAKTAKEIAPLAPSANPERFTSIDKVEKWFKRNCGDVLGRACTLKEKGDVLAYLLSLK